MKLHRNSKKLRVVPSLSGNAHYLFPAFGISVAVRVYDDKNVAVLQEILDQNIENKTAMVNNDFDGITTFRDSFKHSIVFFSLPPDVLEAQLGSVYSVVNQLQFCLGEASSSPKVIEEVMLHSIHLVSNWTCRTHFLFNYD